MDRFLLFMFHFFLSCLVCSLRPCCLLFLAAIWSPAGGGGGGGGGGGAVASWLFCECVFGIITNCKF